MTKFVLSTSFLCCILCFSSFLSCSALHEERIPRPRFGKGASIAIVGAGPAGLFAARNLLSKGFHNVVVFEREAESGGIPESVLYQDHIYDLSTIIYPPYSLHGAEEPLYPPLERLFEEYGTERRFIAAATNVFDLDSLQFLPLPPYFGEGITIPQLIPQLNAGFALLLQASPSSSASSTAGREDIDVSAWGGERDITFGEWADIVQVPAATGLIAFLHQFFQTGEPYEALAVEVLKGATQTYPTVVKSLLQELQQVVFSGTLFELFEIHPNLQELVTSTPPGRYQFFPNGYETFFQEMVRREEIDVRLSTEVTRVSPYRVGKSHRWRVLVETIKQEAGEAEEKEVHHFDAVILASRTFQTLEYLDKDLPVIPYLEAVTTGLARSVMIHIPSLDENEDGSSFSDVFFFNNAATLVVYPYANYFQSPSLGNDFYDHCPVFTRPYNDTDVFLCFAYAHPEEPLSSEAFEERLREDLAAMGVASASLEQLQLLRDELWNYPQTVPPERFGEDGGWSKAIDTLQGERHLFYVGEALATYGIPAQMETSDFVLDRFFF
ncbi:hypothetical protein QOT17_011278 [Balamuthia mandrillaris]